MRKRAGISCLLAVVFVLVSGISFSQDSGMTIKKFILCTKVTDKGPEGEAKDFREDNSSICCWTETEAAEGQARLVHAWYYGNRKKASFKPEIDPVSGAAHSCIEIKKDWLGMWTVKVSDKKGNLLESKSFFIKGIPDKMERAVKKKNVAYAGIGISAQVKSGLKLASIKIGKKIKRKKLTGETSTVPSSWKRVFCWIDIPSVKERSSVKFVWYYFKKKMAETVVDIKPPASRAWAYKTMRPQYVGDWCVEVLDGEDIFIKEICFRVKK